MIWLRYERIVRDAACNFMDYPLDFLVFFYWLDSAWVVISSSGSRKTSCERWSEYGWLAQLAEHLTLNQGVQGSNPWSSTRDIRNPSNCNGLRIFHFRENRHFCGLPTFLPTSLWASSFQIITASLSTKTFFQQIHSCFTSLFIRMNISIQRDPYVGMPHQQLHILVVRTACDHVGSIGVAKSMHVEPCYPQIPEIVPSQHAKSTVQKHKWEPLCSLK